MIHASKLLQPLASQFVFFVLFVVTLLLLEASIIRSHIEQIPQARRL